jgi:hypothetical protein
MLGIMIRRDDIVVFGAGSMINLMLGNTTIGKREETICVSMMKNTI